VTHTQTHDTHTTHTHTQHTHTHTYVCVLYAYISNMRNNINSFYLIWWMRHVHYIWYDKCRILLGCVRHTYKHTHTCVWCVWVCGSVMVWVCVCVSRRKKHFWFLYDHTYIYTYVYTYVYTYIYTYMYIYFIDMHIYVKNAYVHILRYKCTYICILLRVKNRKHQTTI